MNRFPYNATIIIPDVTFDGLELDSEKRKGTATHIPLSDSKSLLDLRLVNCYTPITKITTILLKPENFVLNNLGES